MKYCEITINTTTEYSELIADAFFSIGCLSGVKIIDKSDVIYIINNNKMWDYIDEQLLQSADGAKVSGYVGLDERESKLNELLDILHQEGVPYGEIVYDEVDDEAWVDTWKKYYQPIVVGKYAIVPKWLNYETDKIKVLMDPGMAFGTGEHESTKMCLELMSEHDFTNKDVIDVGTGSGILGIAAIKSGAKSCYMCDIDDIAVQAAKSNAEINKVRNDVTIELSDLLTNNISGDIILANLTADILIALLKGLLGHVHSGSRIICSGIIHKRKADVVNAFTAQGFKVDKERIMGEWDALEFVWN